MFSAINCRIAAWTLILCVQLGSLMAECPSQECEPGPKRLTPKFSLLGYCLAAFDFEAEAVFLYRCNNAKNIALTSNGVAGDIVLDSDELDSGWQTGWRLAFKVFFDDCDRIEAKYFFGGEWSDSAKVRSSINNLYSVFSLFGASPSQGYSGTDRSSLQRISANSEFETWEINYLRHVSLFEIPCCCNLDGSLLCGYRHFNLCEEFKLATRSTLNDAHMNDHVHTINSLNGFQIGAEGWFPIHSCIDIGVEIKGASYFNSYEQKTSISAPDDLAKPLHEKKDGWGGAWGLEGGVKVCYEILPSLYLRAGYLYLYIDNVALAIENFNKKSPFDNKRRHKKLNDSGSITYQGATVGIDWCW